MSAMKAAKPRPSVPRSSAVGAGKTPAGKQGAGKTVAGRTAAGSSGAARSGARASGHATAGRLSTLVAALFAVLLAAALPTALMLTLALLPTVVAMITDRSEARSATISIGALNLAGTWPFLLKLWTTGHTVVNAMQIILSPIVWLIIYAAAGVGWLLYVSFPALVSACMAIFAGRQLAQLRARQKQLIEEWGPEVATKPSSPHH
jgi:hypothetical protein